MLRVFAAVLLALLVAAGAGATPASAQSDAGAISEIRVEGAQRIDPATVLTYSTLSTGDEATPSALNQAVGRLFATDLFEDVEINLDGTVVTITVLENPIINRISIEGNDVLNDDQLLEVLDVQPRRVYTEKVALDATETLIEIYRQSGRYAAVIEPKIINLPERRVDLVFEVDEGPLIKISSVRFIGNEAFSDRALRNVIESREARWYILFSANDKYDAGRLSLDSQRLRQFYLQNGYANVDVVRATGELLADRSGFVLTFQIEEGEQYTVNSVAAVSEIEGVDTDEVLAVGTMEIGEVYDVRALEETLSLMTNKLGEFGYAFVDLTPDIKPNEDELSLDILINIGEARRNYVEEIVIKGNDRTLDSVIRRRFELVEGDSFNQLKLTRSERNVRNLGYFSDVEVEVLPGSGPDQSVVEMAVEEASTGSLQLGFGYSTFDKGSVTLGISENNFLGTGRGARASFSVSSSSTNFRAGITEPYLFDRNLAGSFDVFRDTYDASGVDQERLGIDLGASFSAARDYRHRLGYRIVDTETKTTSTSPPPASVSGDEGGKLVSEVSYSLAKDTRDSRIDPRRGYLLSISESLAGLGGDATYLRSVVRGQYFKPFYFNTFVVGLDAEAGLIDGLGEKVTRSNRFLLGGRKLRGFASAGIGPRDSGDNSAVGGNQYFATSANLTSNYGIDKDLGIRWTTFLDAGSVWGTDYPKGVTGPDNDAVRSSFGYGMLWDTALGPMSFIWGYPIDKESYDRTKVFQFTFGGRF